MGRRLPLVELEGSPRAWGLQHGRAAKAAVGDNVQAYLRRFTEWARISREDVRRRADAYRKVIEDTNPDYAAAMEGIAEGADQDLLDVAAVNVRYEIMYSEFATRGMERRGLAAGGCTSFALLPELTANGHLLIGQNWDWLPEVRGIVLRARDEDGLARLAFTEAGIAGAKIGLNGAGVGLAINGLVSNRDSWSHLRRPFHVRCWEILAARTLREAERSIEGGARSCSANFLMAHTGPDGPQVSDLETSPDGECRLEPRDGYLAHTNHFLDEKALGVWQPLAEDRPSTFTRYRRIQETLQGWTKAGHKVTIEDLKGMLRDHTSAPNSLCRHADPSLSPDDRYETVVSVIMDLDAKEMYIAPGTPCTARYRRIPLAGRA